MNHFVIIEDGSLSSSMHLKAHTTGRKINEASRYAGMNDKHVWAAEGMIYGRLRQIPISLFIGNRNSKNGDLEP